MEGGSDPGQEITEVQRELVKKLYIYSKTAALAYGGALHAYYSEDYPDRVGHFAYSLRDVIDRLAKTRYDKVKDGDMDKYMRAKLLARLFDSLTGQEYDHGKKYERLAEIHSMMSGIGHEKKQITAEEISSVLSEVEDILNVLARYQSDINDEVDQIISQDPSKRGAERLINMQTNGTTQIRIANSLTEVWLHKMADAGYFRNPRDGECWIAHKYLARCSKLHSKKVAEMITSYRLEALNGNTNICADLMNCVPDLRIDDAAAVAHHMLDDKWYGAFWVCVEEYIGVVGHLYLNGRRELAAELLGRGLSVPPVDPSGLDMPNTEWAQMQTGELVGRIIGDPQEMDLVPLIGALADAFDAIILRKAGDGGVSDDVSSMCVELQSITDPDPIFHKDMPTSLVIHVWNCICVMARRGGSQLGRAAGAIAARRFLVWRRVEMLAYQRFPDGFIERMEDYAVRYLDRDYVQREHHDMLEAHFMSMSAPVRERIIRIIMDGFDDGRLGRIRDEQGEEAAEHIHDIWRLERLEAVRDGLDHEEVRLYKELAKKHGRTSPGRIFSYDIGRVGPAGNREPAEDIDADRIFEDARRYKPGPMQPDLDMVGIGRLAEERPRESSGRAMELAHSHPIVLGWFLDGLRESLRVGGRVCWKEVMRLALHIFRFGQEPDVDMRAACLLLVDAIEGDLIGGEMEGLLWEVTRRSTDIPFNRKTWDADFERDMDALEISTSGIDGLSFHVLVRYALWHHSRNGGCIHPGVRRILDEYLENRAEQTVSRSGVLGKYLSYLYRLDWEWTIEAARRIHGRQKKIAFWDGFVHNNGFNAWIFEGLSQKYNEFLNGEIIRCVKNKSIYTMTFDHVLAAHVNGLEEADSMFKRFLKSIKNDPPEALVDHCIVEIGELMRGGRASKGFNAGRLDALWTHQAFLENDLDGWFMGSRMDREWAIRSYSRYVVKRVEKRAGRFRLSGRLVGEMEKYWEEFPGPVLDCLEGWADNAYNEFIPDGVKGILDGIERANNGLAGRCRRIREKVLSREMR